MIGVTASNPARINSKNWKARDKGDVRAVRIQNRICRRMQDALGLIGW